jgi:hypothetical protein
MYEEINALMNWAPGKIFCFNFDFCVPGDRRRGFSLSCICGGSSELKNGKYILHIVYAWTLQKI